jgi:hypothetical protein
MRIILTTAALLFALAAPGAWAAPPQRGQTTGTTPPKSANGSKHTAPATHAATGVVRSVSDTTLVIARKKTTGRAMTFLISPSVERAGTIAVGSAVSVRYHTDGKTLVATAITAQPAARSKTTKTSTPKKS